MAAETQYSFETLAPETGVVPVTRVTPDDAAYVHAYFDVCPFSPSQRYLAATRLPYQDRPTRLGDAADVCVIDLERQTIRTVYSTTCWGFQTGANLNWGATDRHLYTNDIVDRVARCVRINLDTGQSRTFSGPMYHIAPDESCVVGFPLELMDVTQPGYGAASADPANPPRLAPGAAHDEGVWRTDLRTDERSLLVSLADVAGQAPEPAPRPDGTFYFWHTKFDPQGTRIMQVLRCLFPDGSGGRNAMVFTLKPDGTDVQYTPGAAAWGAPGGHPNWHPDGEHLIRNIKVDGRPMRYCQVPCRGGDATVLSDTLPGGGHPSIEPTGRWIITDAFPTPDTVALRLADLETHREQDLCVLPTIDRSSLSAAVLRLDGHPAWSRDHTRVCFQAAHRGLRQLFVADVTAVG